MSEIERKILLDRSLEVSENVMLIWGCVLCNTTTVQNNTLLQKRCDEVMKEITDIHYTIKRVNNEQS